MSSPESIRSQRRTRPATRLIAQIPFLIVAALVLVAVILVLADRWRRGAFVFGGAALLSALLRAVLPTSRAGLLQVRGRMFDIIAMGTAGVAILWLAASIDALGTGIDQ